MAVYLVSGASGFVGRALCGHLLARGCRVRALLHHETRGPWQEQLVCDLGGGGVPVEACRGVDGVFHLAGIAHLADQNEGDAALYWRVNVDGTQQLVDAAVAAGIKRFVYFSSVKAAADPHLECVDETWDPVPHDAYGLSKREAERRVRQASERGLGACVLRPTLVYGPGVKGNLQRMVEAVASGRFPPIPEVGNRRSMVSVGDLAEAAWLGMTNEAGRGQTYIVADGVDYSTRDIYIAMCQALGRKAPSWCLPLWVLAAAARAGDFVARASGKPIPVSSAALERLCGSACYRADRIREELGWEPVDDFYRVVAQMVSAAEPRRVKNSI